MKPTRSGIWTIAAIALVAVSPAARAQFAVIDVASVTQLIHQVQTTVQELQTAQSELAQARQEYQSFTGTRGMQNLLSGTNRNYLPTDVTSLEATLSGSGGTYGALASSVQAAMNAIAVLSPAALASLSASERSAIVAQRQAVALQQGISQQALANSSGRFTQMQQLINTIGSAQDPKAILDLEARISAEQGMLEAEQTKLRVLYQTVLAQQAAAEQSSREQAIADIGSLRTLPPMGLSQP
ncbi:MAG: type IV secretion system protein [Steroidobacteraceae bacterium]